MSFIIKNQLRKTIYALENKPPPKNILFILFDVPYENLPRWNGQIFHTENVAMSGSHQSVIMNAEFLARCGYSVYVACAKCIPTTYNGVVYETINNISFVLKYINILIIPNWLETPIDVTVWKSLEKIIIWYHLKEGPSESYLSELKKNKNIKVHCNFITEYVKRHSDAVYPYYKDYIDSYSFIRNPIPIEFKEYNKKIPHSFVFHSSFRRGGGLACSVFDRLDYKDKIMHICSYVKFEVENSTYKIEGKGKRDLYELLETTEYFIYPGVNMTTHILTKETDCLAIAEALLHEVIVFAFPVGALYENYKDAIVWIPFPTNANLETINSTCNTVEPELCSNEVIQSIKGLIEDIDSDLERKKLIKKRGRDLVLKQRNMNMLGNELIGLIQT